MQDPLRKLTPGQPVLFVGFVGVVFGAACLGAWARGIPVIPKSIFEQHRQLAMPMSFLLLLIIVQAFNSYLRFDNPMLPLIGLLTYLLPLLSVAFAYQLVVRQGEIRIYQFMKWYIVCVSFALTTVYLEYAGYDWSVLGQVGARFIIFDETGKVLKSLSGIFRASEIAAWHAMTSACFIFLLASLRKRNFVRWLSAGSAIALLIGVGVLTGRRKIVMELAIFVSTYLILWTILENGARKLIIVVVTGAALVGYTWLAAELRDSVREPVDAGSLSYSLYVQRSQSVFQAAPSRFVELGIAPIMWAYEGYGLFGAGLGVGTQGTQHFGGEGGSQGRQKAGWARSRLSWAYPASLWWGGLQFHFFSMSGGSCKLHRELHQGLPDFPLVFSVFSWPTWRRSRLPRKLMATCSYC